MKTPIMNSFIALALLSSTFGALAVYKTTDKSGRTIASVEQPIVAEYASAQFIKEQRMRMEEVTVEMKSANGEMMKVTKRIIQIETRLAAQMKKGVMYNNIAEINKLKGQLASVKAAKAKVEVLMTGLKKKHKKAIQDLTTTNQDLSNIVKANKLETEALKSKIAGLERSGLDNKAQIAQLKLDLKAKEAKTKQLAQNLIDFQAQIDIKNSALAEATLKGQAFEESILALNSKIEELNGSIGERDQQIGTLEESNLALQSDFNELKEKKEELDLKIGKLILDSEAKAQIIADKEKQIQENQDVINCQKDEIKVNTEKISKLQALVEKSTKAIKDSEKAINAFKEEKEERTKKITRLEKENKKFKADQKEFDSVIQMMMSQFMMMPQMMQPRTSMPGITNPLTSFSMSDMFMLQMMQGGGSKGLGTTGLPMFDPYATPQVITNNYFTQKNPYGGEFNDFNVREMYQPTNRAPSGYFNF